jgi:hypothetical protein
MVLGILCLGVVNAVNAQTKATFIPRITLTETYDDNIELQPDNEKSDWITTVSPGCSLLLQSEKTNLNLDLQGGLALYLRDSSRDTIRYSGSLSWYQELAQHLSMQVSDTLTRTEDPVTEEDGKIVDIASERDVQYRNTGEISLTGQFGPDDRVTGGYRNRLLDSRADQTEDSRANEGFLNLNTWFAPQFGFELSTGFSRWEFQQSNDFTGTPTEDFYNYQAGLKLNYRWRPQRIVYAGYNFVYQDFDNEFGVDNNDYFVHQPSLGLTMSLSQYTSLGVEVGYFLQDPDKGDKQGGFVFNGSFNTQREKASIGLSSNTGYNLDYGSSDNQGFSKFSDNSATLSYQLTEAFTVSASARYRWDDYTETNRTDHTYGGKIGISYKLQDWLGLTLEGGHLRRDSNDNAEEFTDNRVTLSIVTSYPIPLFGE